MSANAPQRDSVRQESEAVDALVRTVFRVEPAEDRSGMLLPEPATTLSEPDEEAQFAAYMRRFFPGSLV